MGTFTILVDKIIYLKIAQIIVADYNIFKGIS